MATYVFDGTQDVSVASFNPSVDTVVIDGFDVADVASFTQSNSSVQLTLSSGVMLTLGGVIFASLSDTNFVTGNSTDIDIAFAALGGGTADGNIVIGSNGDDTLTAVSASTSTETAFIYGLQGTDDIDATGFSNATIYAGQGDDNITIDGGLAYGNDGADEFDLSGVAAGDTVTVFGGSNVVGDADGNDTIVGTGALGDLLIYGNAGGDSISGGEGSDTIFGGQGNDGITVGGGDALVYGNQGDDTIVGGDGDSTLFGGQDNDSITGGDGDEAIYGNLGDDILITSLGVDTLVGGAGNDSIGSAVDTTTGVVTVGDFIAGGTIYGGLGEDVINVSVTGGATGAQTSIFGGNNIVGAADGDDSITVLGTGEVSVFGNEGNDTIVGGAGSFSIFGGVGNDSLTGGSAGDEVTMLTGGAGNDIFVANTIGTAGTNDIGYSMVTDFTKGSDTIEFSTDPTSFATVTVGAATTFDTVQDVIAAYEGQLAANGALAVVVQSGELAGDTVLIHATTAATADEVIVLSGVQNTLALSDFS